jgi:hypothetical protein
MSRSYFAITCKREHLPDPTNPQYKGCSATVQEKDGQWSHCINDGNAWVDAAKFADAKSSGWDASAYAPAYTQS